jgi:FG-GAP-like repeat/RTX calcium-binding nonapeptide repeat (4 copies)
MSNEYVQDALPVTITGTPGLSQVSLADVLKQAYGDQWSSISSVNVAYYGADYLMNRKDDAGHAEKAFSYWDPSHPTVTSITHNGVDIGASTQKNFNTVAIDKADFANVMIDVGNNIMPNVYIQVPTAHNSDGSTDYQELNVTTVPKELQPHLISHVDLPASEIGSILSGGAHSPDTTHAPPNNHFGGGMGLGGSAASDHLIKFPGSDTALLDAFKGGFVASHVPSASEVVAAARSVATYATAHHVANVNDCHFIAMDIAALAGAPLDPVTQTATDKDSMGNVVKDSAGHVVSTQTPDLNEEGGFWRKVPVNVSNWQTLVKPGDIVRLAWNGAASDPHGFHTLTVTSGINAKGEIEVVDNGGNKIQEHWVDYNPISNTSEVTIYRLTTDGQYLIDEHTSTGAETYLGTGYNDLMKAGSGGDTLSGGEGYDTLVGGIGKDHLNGGNGHDTMTGGAGNDTLDGGAEVDTAVFSGKFSDYKITVNGDTATITDLRAGSPDGTDTFKNVELLAFSDGLKHFSPSDYPIVGGAGNDKIVDRAGNDSIDGGAGRNELVLSGNQSDYKITVNGDTATITDLRAGSPDGTDTFKNIEFLHFADGLKHFSAKDYPLAGGAGMDSIIDRPGNDTGIDGGAGVDRLVLTGNQSDYKITVIDGVNTITDLRAGSPDGTDTFKNIELLKFADGLKHFSASDYAAPAAATVPQSDTHSQNTPSQDTHSSDAHSVAPVTHHVANDFNGDGISDVLFENGKGSVALWELNGNHIASNTTVGSLGTDWHSIGTSDFNGDGKADVLWENSKGQVAMWEMNGDHVASNTTVGSVGTDWHAIGTNDFNGDGKADVLWENSKGQVAMWEMNGDHIASNTTVGSVGTDWHAIGTGDFNGDGKADILWENSKGQVAEWQMNGDHIASNTTVGSVGTDWHVAGTGDFNGDGKTDLLWQNAKGQVAEWQMNGDHIASNTTVGSAPGWTVIGTGDYNHDGKADVLLQNASGRVAEWQMNGDHITENLTVGSHTIDWHTV